MAEDNSEKTGGGGVKDLGFPIQGYWKNGISNDRSGCSRGDQKNTAKILLIQKIQK